MVFDPGRLQSMAVDLAETIAEAATRTDHGLSWTGPRLPQGHAGYEPRMLNSYLYGGTAGIALFYAAVARVCGERRFADLALEILAPIRRELAKGAGEPLLDPHSKDSYPAVGGFHGYGSLLYVLARVGELSHEPGLVDEARRGVWILSPELVGRDRRFDLVFGSAGLVLALVAVLRTPRGGDRNSGDLGSGDLGSGDLGGGAETRDASDSPVSPAANEAGDGESRGERSRGDEESSLSKVASSVADHLMEHRVETSTGHRLWAGADDAPPLAGFSHGMAGIALGLLRLHDHTGRPDLLAAVDDVLAYEDSLFDAEHGNWRDVRPFPTEYSAFLSRWCHGAPGIALARLGHPETRGRGDVPVALATTAKTGWTGVDHLCCGIVGRAEVLLTAANDLSAPEYRQQGRRLLLQSIDRAQREGSFRFVPRTAGPLFDPSFFLGAAGIGYTLLRFVDESLPCVARLD